MQALLGNVLVRIIVDAGHRGQNAPVEHQKRKVNLQIKHEFKRRAAIAPVIGELSDATISGDATNPARRRRL